MDLTVKLHEPMVPLETGQVKVVAPLQRLLLPSVIVVPASSVTNVSGGDGDLLQSDPYTVTVVPVGPRYVEKVSEGPPVIVNRADAAAAPTFAS